MKRGKHTVTAAVFVKCASDDATSCILTTVLSARQVNFIQIKLLRYLMPLKKQSGEQNQRQTGRSN